MKILAIDPATKLGWAVNNTIYGLENYTVKAGESTGMKWIRLKSFLYELIKKEGTELVVYERAGGRFKNDIASHSKFIAIIELCCTELNVEYRAYSATEIKKYATGKGNASKGDMIAAAVKNYAYSGTDDNIADALHIWNMANESYSN